MSSFLFWPYDEVSLSASADNKSVLVKSPWLEASVAIDMDERIELLLSKFTTQSLSPEDMGLVSWFFNELRAYPLCYIVPGEKGEQALDLHQLKDRTYLGDSIEELILCSLSEEADVNAELTVPLAKEVTHKLGRRQWAWDAEAALAFARLGSHVHPESLFSVVRRYHMLDVLECDRGREAFAFIEGLSGPSFALAAGILVRQNHFVTQKCHEALRPALETAQSARPLLEAFMKEEQGHDKILNQALQYLTNDADELPVSYQTQTLMHLLRFAARRNFLAFAMSIDFFERNSYQEVDPLAQLLLRGGYEKAAKHINRHMEINEAGEHDNVGCSFLKHMAPCDADYALEAMRIAEAVSVVMGSVTEAALDLYQQRSRLLSD